MLDDAVRYQGISDRVQVLDLVENLGKTLLYSPVHQEKAAEDVSAAFFVVGE